MSLESALSQFTTQPLLHASRTLFKDALGIPLSPLADAAIEPKRFFRDQHKEDKHSGIKHLYLVGRIDNRCFQHAQLALDGALDLDATLAATAKDYDGMFVIAVDMTDADFTRSDLASRTREINRVFTNPVIVLFKHLHQKQPVLSIGVISRRDHKRTQGAHVLGKVSMIREIRPQSPHSGHIEILKDFSFTEIEKNAGKGKRGHKIDSFKSFHAALEAVFDTDLLNKRFYKDLANWYFWALPQVEFPADLEKDDEKRRATGLIRLLTRLIFCWFLKEKDGLIPEKLFQPAELSKLLKGFDPESETSSTYYHAILQNLFFATLNQRMGKDGKGNPYRVFAKDEGFHKNRATYDVNNLYRYENLFAVSEDEALALFADIPFLNGGLFECLDRTEDETNKKLYLDGFSRRKEKRPHVPDRLFFDSGETADLSHIYDDKSRKAEPVTGLISILNRYKFTIVENTPIDQEIALDPELLGKVFENLLASYNEETKTTARKQTGSFYTPRPIVDYMVDESLKAHLCRCLIEKAGMQDDDAKAGLDLLFTYTEKEHPFSPKEVSTLITAIDEVKILDPACGSGAFPMGVLHKLVYLLSKIDKGNERWRDTQISKVEATIQAAQKIDDVAVRDSTIAGLQKQISSIQSAFADNELDYGRKLFLIENCLYGVDIQPIAIQITKLRFFISLVCDQKTNKSKDKNHGIRPLPNLETKFVAADTLIGLPIPEPELFVQALIEPIEKEIEECYHRHFAIQNRKQKRELQDKIKSLRLKLTDTIANGLGAGKDTELIKKAKHVAEWDPFDPQSSADFFDPHWMFGRVLKDGFDLVIGNPPYISVEKFARTKQQEVWRNTFRTFAARGDIYCFFYERGLSILKEGGILGYITSNKFQKAGYGKALRQLLAAQRVEILVDFCELPVFEASTDPIIVITAKASPAPNHEFPVLVVKSEEEFGSLAHSVATRGSRYKSNQLKGDGWSLEGADGLALVDKLRSKGTPLFRYVDGRIYYGIKTGLNEAFVFDSAVRDRLINEDTNAAKLIKPWIRGMDIKRWKHTWNGLYFFQIPSSENFTHPWSGQNQQEALITFRKYYPSISRFVLQHEQQLRTRTDKGTYFWELRSCAYWSAFNEPKIVFNETSKNLHAYLDTDGNVINKTGFIILTPEAPFVLSVLNSTALDWFYRSTFPAWGDVWNAGRVQFRGNLMNQVPIPAASAADKAKLTKLAEGAAKAATAGDTATVTLIERDIDEIVYRLFDLTPAEITQIETALANTRGLVSTDETDDEE